MRDSKKGFSFTLLQKISYIILAFFISNCDNNAFAQSASPYCTYQVLNFSGIFGYDNASGNNFWITDLAISGAGVVSANNFTGGATNAAIPSAGFDQGVYLTNGATVTQNMAPTFSMSRVGSASGFACIFHVYVDWNNDNDLVDAGEEILTSGTIAATTSNFTSSAYTIPFTAPTGGNNTVGAHRMRVVCEWQGETQKGPCGATGINGGQGNAKDFTLTVAAAAPCSGTPPQLSVSPASTSVCNGSSTTLSLTGITVSGYTYQWQQSATSGGPYSNASGTSTNASYTTPTSLPFNPTYYVCQVTCTNSGLTTQSLESTVAINSFINCYCIPNYAVANAGTRGITQIILNGVPNINNTSIVNNVAPYYTLYTAASPVSNAGIAVNNSYTLSVKVGTQANALNNVGAWIDYDQNGVFSASEFLGSFANATASSTTNINFTVPLTANTGATGMRIRHRYGAAVASTDACTNFTGAVGTGGAGETEDYRVNIASCLAPSVQASGNSMGTIITTDATINWSSNGNGDAVLVVVNQGSAPAGPSQSTSYAGNNNFPSAPVTSGTSRVVYSGTGSSVNVTGLLSNVTYFYSIYTYFTGTNCYNVNAPASGSFTTANSPMTYISSTTTQSVVTSVAPNTTNNQVIGIQITTSTGTSPALNLTSLTFNINGSTQASDIAAAKVWYTGTSSVFATTTQFGSTVSNPVGSIAVSGSVALSSGTNYFWLTYDIAASPTIGDVVDAECTSIDVGGAQIPSVTAPSGNRTILLNYCTPSPGAGPCSGGGDAAILSAEYTGTGSTFNYTGGSCSNGTYGVDSYTGNLNIGNAYTITVVKGNSAGPSGTFGARFIVWMDLNNDGDFTDIISGTNEMVMDVTQTAASATGASFTIPSAGVNPGSHRIRVWIAYTGSFVQSDYLTISTGCEVLSSLNNQGQIRDFNINLVGGCTPPVIGACPADITQCDNSVATFATPTATGTTPTVTCAPSSGSTFAAGTTSVTCTATNACGSSSCSFNVTINETPVIGACPADIVQCDNHVATWTTPTSSGTPAATVSCTPASGSTFAAGTTSVTCTAANACGSSSCSFNVIINETPVIGACPTDIVQCDNHVATWTTPTSSGTPAATVSCTPASGSTFAAGTTSVTCTAANACGSSSCSFNVTINETPVIGACPADITQDNNHVVTWINPTATGTPNPTVSCSPASGSNFAAGTTVVTCTASNVCGTSTCSFNVTINDGPVIGPCPADIVQCDNHIATWTNPTATGTPTPVVNCSPASGSTFATGTTIVTCTATNIAGSSSCAFNVTIQESPVISGCPSDITQCDNYIATWTNPSATGSPTASVSCSPASGSTFSAGVTTVTCTATNACGSSSCSFSVTVNETPVIGSCPANITTCNPVVTFATPSATGTPAATVNCSPASGSTFSVGTTVVTCTAINSCGSSSCNFSVTVQSSSTAATSVTSNAANNEICLGSNVTLTQNNGTLGFGADWYWYEGGCGTGSVLGNGSSVSITPATAGTHTYYVRAEGTCNTTACVSITITVKTAPPAGTIHITSAPNDGCVGGTATVSVNAVATATFYRWSCASGGILFNGQPSPYDSPSPTVTISFTALPAGAGSGWSVCVFPGNACGSANTICTWIRATISKPNPITGSVIGCPNTTATYSCNNVNAASYQWSITGNATITGNGSRTITVNFGAGFTTGTLCVHAQTSCGYNSADVCINLSGVTAMPGSIAGNGNVCPNGSSTFSIAAVPGATSYNWTCSVAGSVVTNNGTSCSIQFPATVPGGSSVCVSSLGPCGTPSAARCKGIASGIPTTPGVISGPNSGQCGSTGVSYSINPVNGATGYLWNANNGAAIVGPNNLSGVTIDFPSAFTTVNLTVVAVNVCGNSNTRSLSVSGIPGLPGQVTGSNAVCNGAVELYNTAGSIGATGYTWTVPANAVILGGQGSTPIIVQWGGTSGNITVRGTNACGNSGLQTFPVTVNCREASSLSAIEKLTAVFPNPTTGKLNIRLNSEESGSISYQLLDVTGRMINAGTLNQQAGVNMYELDLSSFAKGVYMIRLHGNDLDEMQKITLE